MKIRCSALGQVMTNGRGTALSKTCQSYVEKLLKEKMYDTRIFNTNKYMEKGLIMEDDAIDLLSEHYKLGGVIKNEEYFENDYITGTPDLILDDCVRDIKCSWDLNTFPVFYRTIPSKDYYWQLQGYMWLTGKRMAYLDYCLTDTPHHLIESECRSMAFRSGVKELNDMEKGLIESRMKFSHHPSHMRIKTFEIKYEPSAIEDIKNRVIEINNYTENVR
jgi:hypothetical protein